MDDKVQALATELNLDLDDELKQTLNSLIESATSIIKSSVNSQSVDIESDLIFSRAVLTLSTQLFYDRTLSQGMSAGLRMMIAHLIGKYGSGDRV